MMLGLVQTGMSNRKEENDGEGTQVVHPESHHLLLHREA